VDALVIAVPVTDLIGPTALDPTALRQKATALQMRLFQTQSALGFCLPVHVVLTRGDALPGFSALVETLPPRLRDDMLGWASPFALDAAYAESWLHAAFETIGSAFLQLQLELHAAAALSVPPDALFQLESHIRALHEPLAMFLGTVFRRTVFQESLFFRGFYITAAPAGGGTRLLRSAIVPAKDFYRARPLPPHPRLRAWRRPAPAGCASFCKCGGAVTAGRHLAGG
jgi:type VI secretion system protein ImpL